MSKNFRDYRTKKFKKVVAIKRYEPLGMSYIPRTVLKALTIAQICASSVKAFTPVYTSDFDGSKAKREQTANPAAAAPEKPKEEKPEK